MHTVYNIEVHHKHFKSLYGKGLLLIPIFVEISKLATGIDVNTRIPPFNYQWITCHNSKECYYHQLVRNGKHIKNQKLGWFIGNVEEEVGIWLALSFNSNVVKSRDIYSTLLLCSVSFVRTHMGPVFGRSRPVTKRYISYLKQSLTTMFAMQKLSCRVHLMHCYFSSLSMRSRNNLPTVYGVFFDSFEKLDTSVKI